MNYKETLTKSEWFRLNGVYYGYPKCCIDNFIARCPEYFDPYPPSKDQKKVSQNTGFVPCLSCTKEILKGKTKLQDLIKTRFCPNPFPDDENDNNKDHFIEMLTKDLKLLNKMAI